MFKSLTLVSLLATFTAASAQSPNAPEQDTAATSQPAPIIRRYQSNGTAMHRLHREQAQITESQPTPGIWLRSESTSTVTTVSATPQRTEIRLDHGRLNVNIHQPSQHSEILIDLPGGQTSLLKDGLYTFNADTNTLRVLRGEAAAWPGPITASADTKAIKVKEDHQLSLIAATAGRPNEMKSVEAYPYELIADLLPLGNGGDRAYADGEYGAGYEQDYPRYERPYPYFASAWGYPGYYGYGYPFAYGIGFGYYGGFRGGYGYRGGFRR